MIKLTIQKVKRNIYGGLARWRIFYPLLVFILKKKGLLNEKMHEIIEREANQTNNFFFIQIGSNDGIKGDPIYLYVKKYSWNGILVEPIKYIFKKLVKNYKGLKGITFENIAIAEKQGTKNFYRLREARKEGLPYWYDEIGSFLPENILKYKKMIPNFKYYFMKEKVKCLTFNSLIKKHKVKKIDLLNIDTEGYDYKILKTINFDKIKPKIILYEDRHLNHKDKIKCVNLLKKQGYLIINLPGDTLAYLANKNPI